MKCPKHPEEDLRREGNYDTGFCSKCLKHYEMCTSVRYMEICSLLKGHMGHHIGSHGSQWFGDNGRGDE